MRFRIQKWGVDLDLRLEAGRLVVTPLTHRENALDDLLSRITTDNLHREIDTGPAVGVESW